MKHRILWDGIAPECCYITKYGMKIILKGDNLLPKFKKKYTSVYLY